MPSFFPSYSNLAYIYFNSCSTPKCAAHNFGSVIRIKDGQQLTFSLDATWLALAVVVLVPTLPRSTRQRRRLLPRDLCLRLASNRRRQSLQLTRPSLQPFPLRRSRQSPSIPSSRPLDAPLLLVERFKISRAIRCPPASCTGPTTNRFPSKARSDPAVS